MLTAKGEEADVVAGHPGAPDPGATLAADGRLEAPHEGLGAVVPQEEQPALEADGQLAHVEPLNETGCPFLDVSSFSSCSSW